MELGVTNVERNHARGDALQEHIGEPARRGSDIETVAPRNLDPERVESVRELLAAPRDVWRRPLDDKVDRILDLFPGLRVTGDETGNDVRLRRRAAVGEPALGEHHVQALAHELVPLPVMPCIAGRGTG